LYIFKQTINTTIIMSLFHGVREFFTPHAEEGSFMEKGCITATEFVEAGDFLVYKCPTWQWSGGEPSKRRSYLPADKQYLVTRNVPCAQRCTMQDDAFPERQEGEWTVFEEEKGFEEALEAKLKNCNISSSKPAVKEMKRSGGQDETCPFSVTNVIDNSDNNPGSSSSSSSSPEDTKTEGEQEFSDARECEDDDFYDTNEDLSVVNDNDNILLTRSYDVYITWDKHYRTPRVWLFGYDEHRNPLTHKQMFEDVSPEHAHKTVTYEYHPHENYMALSIHPCKHASVMKKLIANWNAREKKGNNKEGLRVDQYLFLFLKFIGTIIPTVEYDYSLNM